MNSTCCAGVSAEKLQSRAHYGTFMQPVCIVSWAFCSGLVCLLWVCWHFTNLCMLPSRSLTPAPLLHHTGSRR